MRCQEGEHTGMGRAPVSEIGVDLKIHEKLRSESFVLNVNHGAESLENLREWHEVDLKD